MQSTSKNIIWEKEVNWDEVKKGLRKYENIMAYFHSTPSPAFNWDDQSFLQFKTSYNGFYRVRRNLDFQKKYFQLMFHNARDSQFENILDEIYKQTNRLEASFSSKLLHTINPEMPIWDTEVLKKLDVKVPSYSATNRKAELIKCYKHIENWYKEKLTSSEGKLMMTLFDSKCGPTKITDLKKIDFMLWQAR